MGCQWDSVVVCDWESVVRRRQMPSTPSEQALLVPTGNALQANSSLPCLLKAASIEDFLRFSIKKEGRKKERKKKKNRNQTLTFALLTRLNPIGGHHASWMATSIEDLLVQRFIARLERLKRLPLKGDSCVIWMLQSLY